MRRVFTSKQQRRQAEAAIIRHMREIQDSLDQHRTRQNEKTEKEQIMSVLTQFVKLKTSVKKK